MKLAMTTVSYRYHLYGFRDIAAIAQRSGFDALELWEPHFIRNQAAIFDYVEKGSLPLPINVCSAYHDLTDFSHRNAHWAEEVFAKLLNCKRLGIPVLRLFTGGLPSRNAGEREWAEWLDRVAKIETYCQQFGIDTVFENHPGTLLDSVAGVERLLQAIDKRGWQRIGLNFDVFHVWEYGVDVLACLKSWYPYVKHVHLKNAYSGTEQFGFSNVYHPMGQYDEVSPLFDGVVKIDDIIRFLMQNAYAGNATLEHFASPSQEYYMSELKQLNKLITQPQSMMA